MIKLHSIPDTLQAEVEHPQPHDTREDDKVSLEPLIDSAEANTGVGRSRQRLPFLVISATVNTRKALLCVLN